MPITTVAELDVYLGSAALVYTPAQKTVAVNQSVALIEAYCDRRFDAANYTQWINGNGTSELKLLNAPLQYIIRASVNSFFSMQLRNAARGSITINTKGEMILVVVGGTPQKLTLSVYPTLALLGAAITALAAGWTWSVIKDDVPTNLRPTAQSLAEDGVYQLESPLEYDWFNILNPNTGILQNDYGFPSGVSNIFIAYRAGYESAEMPADVQNIANMLAADILRYAESDGTLKSESLGDYSWTANDKDLFGKYKEMLSSYKRYAV